MHGQQNIINCWRINRNHATIQILCGGTYLYIWIWFGEWCQVSSDAIFRNIFIWIVPFKNRTYVGYNIFETNSLLKCCLTRTVYRVILLFLLSQSDFSVATCSSHRARGVGCKTENALVSIHVRVLFSIIIVFSSIHILYYLALLGIWSSWELCNKPQLPSFTYR
jgi:hypothetical protein